MKPANILLGSTGPYVIDFGIARAAGVTQLTRGGAVIGTPQYMSPEHALGEAVTGATDLFSLGLIAAVAATGRHPYGDGGATALGVRIANTERMPPDLGGYPAPLRPLLERCLTADPAARITPGELARLSERAAGRPLRAFEGWLPAPLMARIAHREAAAAKPVPPPAPRPTPTRPDAPAQAGPVPPAGQPTVTAPPRPAAPPPFVSPPTAPPASRAAGRSRSVPLAAAAVAAMALTAVVTWAAVSPDGDAGGSGESRTNGKDTAAGGAAGSGPGSGSSPAPASPTPKPAAAYTLVFQDKPLTLRAPAFNTGTHVDLDAPKISPSGEIGKTTGVEFTYQDWSDAGLRFVVPLGRSAGTTPEQCRTGVDTDTLPSSVLSRELNEGTFLAKGTVLCTVTSEHNLAMLRITDVRVPAKGASGRMPDHVMTLTLWKTAE
ncbi:serine/threonine-protein kinase [Streptomyces goshikiensis]|uniref:serine/threonine-protein kinase n=1 Tax=Streptomyces goshikiensis TaxID=1942 RepID=UPI003682CE8B